MTRAKKTDPDSLVTVAGELLEEAGPTAVTMRAVGERAGVSAMAIYRHFPDRDSLLTAVVDRAFGDLGAEFARGASGASGAEAELMGMLEAFVDLALARPHLFAQMFTERRPGARVLPGAVEESPTLRLVVASLRKGVAEGAFADADLDEVAVSVAALLQGLCLARYAGRIGGSEEYFRGLVDRAVRTHLRGLG